MSYKNKILTGLAAVVFSLFSQSNLEAIPADPNNLPKGWKQVTEKKESQRRIRIKVDNKEYLETLITTENIIELKGEKRKPYIWATTDLEGKVINDITTCRKADFAATIAYLNESCDLKEITENLSKCYKNASKLTFGYDILEKALKKLIEIEGGVLKQQLTGSTGTLSELLKEEIKEEVKDYISEIKEKLFEKIEEKGLKATKEIKDEIKKIIENSVYYKLNKAGEKLEEALEVLKENRETWSYEDAARFYPKFKKAWTNASSIFAFWSTLKEYTAEEITKEIADSLSKGLTGNSLEELIGVSLNKDGKLTKAFKAMEEEKKSKLKFFEDNIEKMFDYTKGSDVDLFLNPELISKKFDLSTPTKTLELFIEGVNNKKFSYNEIKGLFTGAELKDIDLITEENYKKTKEESDEKILDHKILDEYILSNKIHVILSKGNLISKQRKKEEEYLVSMFVNEGGDWKIFTLDGKEKKQIERMMSPIKSFNEGLELTIRSSTYMEFKRFYGDTILYDLWSKEYIKKNLERCKEIIEKEISSRSYTEEELEELNKGKSSIEKEIQELINKPDSSLPKKPDNSLNSPEKTLEELIKATQTQIFNDGKLTEDELKPFITKSTYDEIKNQEFYKRMVEKAISDLRTISKYKIKETYTFSEKFKIVSLECISTSTEEDHYSAIITAFLVNEEDKWKLLGEIIVNKESYISKKMEKIFRNIKKTPPEKIKLYQELVARINIHTFAYDNSLDSTVLKCNPSMALVRKEAKNIFSEKDAIKSLEWCEKIADTEFRKDLEREFNDRLYTKEGIEYLNKMADYALNDQMKLERNIKK